MDGAVPMVDVLGIRTFCTISMAFGHINHSTRFFSFYKFYDKFKQAKDTTIIIVINNNHYN